MSDIYTSAAVDSFSGIGESIGNIVTGEGGIDDAFQSLFKTIGGYLQKLGVHMQAAVLL